MVTENNRRARAFAVAYPKSTFGPAPGLTALVYETVAATGENGCSMAELVAATGKSGDTLLGTLGNLRGRGNRRVMLFSLYVHGKMARYFAATVPREVAQRVVDEMAAPIKAAIKAESKRLELSRKARFREAERIRKASAKAEREADRQAAKEAAAVRKEQERRAKKLARLAEKEAMLAEKRERNQRLINESRSANRAAAIVLQKAPRLWTAPEPVVVPKIVGLDTAPKTVAERRPGRFEVTGPVVGLFRSLGPGRYADEPASCYARSVS